MRLPSLLILTTAAFALNGTAMAATTETTLDRPSDQAVLGAFVVDEVESGVKGKDLADAIHKKQDELKAKPEADADVDKDTDLAKHPGAKKRGLTKADFPGMGKFVQEQLAKGVHGEDLAAAIHHELDARHPGEHGEAGAGHGEAGGDHGAGHGEAGADHGTGHGEAGQDHGAGHAGGTGKAH